VNGVDLCAGAGGWDVPARELGLELVGIENDTVACETRLSAGLQTLREDVAALKPELYVHRNGIVIGSPPCQGFSDSGKRLGRGDWHHVTYVARQLASGYDRRASMRSFLADKRSMLVVEPLRWALATSPTHVVLEQVPAVLPFWELCAQLLEANGYSTWTGLLRAEEFGVPQTRKRAFLIARRDGRPAAPPTPTHERYRKGKPRGEDPALEPWISMAEALGYEEGPEPSPAPTVSGGGTGSGGGVEVFAGAYARKRAALAVNTRGNRKTPGGNEFPTSGPSWALTSKARSWHLDGVKLTAGEAATLQTFPPKFPFQGSRSKQFEQIGNAVPLKLARAVLEAAIA
jgi:DNA (cytosine-5)-methyltransferase 1